jgi:hypothetical protein
MPSSLKRSASAETSLYRSFSVGLSSVAAFSNVGKALLLGQRKHWLNWTNGGIFSGAPHPWFSSGGSEGCLLIRAGHHGAHRIRAKMERGIWVFHVEIHA